MKAKLLDRWAEKYDFCTGCGLMEIPHKGHGMCRKCFKKAYTEEHKQEATTVKFYCEICKKSYDTGVDTRQVNKALFTIQNMQEIHANTFHNHLF